MTLWPPIVLAMFVVLDEAIVVGRRANRASRFRERLGRLTQAKVSAFPIAAAGLELMELTALLWSAANLPWFSNAKSEWDGETQWFLIAGLLSIAMFCRMIGLCAEDRGCHSPREFLTLLITLLQMRSLAIFPVEARVAGDLLTIPWAMWGMAAMVNATDRIAQTTTGPTWFALRFREWLLAGWLAEWGIPDSGHPVNGVAMLALLVKPVVMTAIVVAIRSGQARLGQNEHSPSPWLIWFLWGTLALLARQVINDRFGADELWLHGISQWGLLSVAWSHQRMLAEKTTHPA